MNSESTEEQIKKFYLISHKDKFTKVEEYQTTSISFDNTKTSSYFSSTQEFGIGTTLNYLDFIYRKRGDEDILLLKLRLMYISGEELMDSPNILKNASIIFLVDNNPIEINEVTQYDFGENEIAGFEEIKEFYNSLFDNEFEQEKLLEIIKKEKEEEEKEEKKRKAKENQDIKRREAKEKRLLEEKKRSERYKQWMYLIVFTVLFVLFKKCK